MSKKLALHQACRDRPTVDFDQRPVFAPAPVVNGTGHKLLSGTRLALDQNRRLGALPVRPCAATAAPECFDRDLFEIVFRFDFLLEIDGLRLKSCLQRSGFFVQFHVVNRDGDLIGYFHEELRVRFRILVLREAPHGHSPYPSAPDGERQRA